MSTTALRRWRERVVGGTPSAWDGAVAWGVGLGALAMGALMNRGDQLDSIPVLGAREETLLATFSLGPALLVAFPLLVLLLAMHGSARPAGERTRTWGVAGALLVAVSGFVAPIALRLAWTVEPAWSQAWEGQAWMLSEIVPAALTGQAPGSAFGEAAPDMSWELASRCGAWAAALVAWMACLPLARRRERVHVGWPALLSFGVLTVAAMLARNYVTSRMNVVPVAIVASLVTASIPCLMAWRFVSSAGERWPHLAESPRRAGDPLQLGRIAAVGALAIVGWIGALAVLSPEALRSVADALRTRPRAGDEAPEFTVTDRAGASIRLADLRGRPVLVSFGASWCGPCKQEFPHLAELGESGAGVGLAVVWISKDADRAALDAFLAQQPKAPTIALANEDVLLSYAVEGIPATFLIDGDGRVAWSQIGFGRRSAADLRDALEALRSAS